MANLQRSVQKKLKFVVLNPSELGSCAEDTRTSPACHRVIMKCRLVALNESVMLFEK